MVQCGVGKLVWVCEKTEGLERWPPAPLGGVDNHLTDWKGNKQNVKRFQRVDLYWRERESFINKYPPISPGDGCATR